MVQFKCDNYATNQNLTKGCDCMKKKSIIVICAVLVISGVATVLVYNNCAMKMRPYWPRNMKVAKCDEA